MQNDTAINYLHDLGLLIKDKARGAKTRRDSSDDAYGIGYLMAYHEVVSLMQSQAHVFGIALEDVALADINPDTELL